MNGSLRLTATVFSVVGLCALASCEPPSIDAFGERCTSADLCEGLQCRPAPDGVRRCLPPRGPAEPGETCAAALETTVIDSGILVDQPVFFGNADDDETLSCGPEGVGDVVIGFELPATIGAVGLAVRLEGAGPATHFAIRGGACGAELRFGCAPGSKTVLIPEAAPGRYEVVIDGPPTGAGALNEAPVRLVVERIPCPLGGLPLDSTSCIVTVTERPLQTPRVGHTLNVGSLGDVVVVGGFDGTRDRADAEVFSSILGRWRYADVPGAYVNHGQVIVGNEVLLFDGEDLDANKVGVLNLDLVDSPVDPTILRDVNETAPLGTRLAAAPTRNGGALVWSVDEAEAYVIEPKVANDIERRCNADVNCGAGETCLQRQPPPSSGQLGICVCITAACEEAVTYDARSVRALPANPTPVSLVSVEGGRLIVVIGGGEAPIGVVDVVNQAPRLEPLEGAEARAGAAGVAINAREVLVVGGTVEGVPSDIVERVNLASLTVERLPWRLPRPVASPSVALLGAHLVVFDGSDEPLILNPATGTASQGPLVTPREEAAVTTGSSDDILIVGGLIDGAPTRVFERLVRVPHLSALPAPVPLCLARALPEDGRVVGSTVNTPDSFRSERCTDRTFPTGRDNLFTFSIDAPSSLIIDNVDVSTDPFDQFLDDNYSFILIRGDCLEGEEVACGVSGETPEEIALFVPELPAGDYTLVVDYLGFSGIFGESQYGGSDYAAQVHIGPPATCPVDGRDPADDVVTGAIGLAPTEAGSSIFEASGRLCPGDVDNILVTHWGGDTSLNAIGVPAEGATVFPAVVDERASVEAGRPIVTAVEAPLAVADSLNGQPVGHYVLQLRAEEESAAFLQWTVQQSFRECTPDADDNLIVGLDNQQPLFARHLLPGQVSDFALCNVSDVDTIILEPGEGGASRLFVDAASVEEYAFEAFAFDGDAFGEAVPFTIEPDGFDVVLQLGAITAPVAVRFGLGPTAPADRHDEATVFFSQDQVGDSCALPLALAPDNELGGVVTGDASAFNNNSDADRLGNCTGFRSPGSDVAYELFIPSGATLSATVLADGDEDIGVYLLDTCSEDKDADVCVAGRDDAGRGESDTMVFTNTGAGATFFVVVDSFFGEPYAYTLTWSLSSP